MLDAERERVAAAAHRLAAEGLVEGTSGNVSARAGDLVAITPTGCRLDSVNASDVAVVDLAGQHREGPLQATSEVDLHLGAYQRYAVGGVVHTHSRYATAVACVLDELPLIHYLLVPLGGPVRVTAYAGFGTAALAAATLDALEGRTAALMSNHGTVAIGRDVETAVEHAGLLEWGCALYWRAAALGTPRRLSEDDVAEAVEALARYGKTKAPEA